MAKLDQVLVVGAGLAGMRAVESVRQLGHAGPIVLVGDESQPPYDRPPLSKQLLAGDWDPERVRLRTDEELRALGVELRLGERATRLDLPSRTVRLASGEVEAFDGLIVATGVRPRTLPGVPALPGLYTLRTLEDSLAIRSGLHEGAEVVVVGAGFIGSEVAATARGYGANVTLVEALAVPLGRVLGEAMGQRCAELHRRAGVNVRTGVGVEAIEGNAHVEGVRLSDGTVIPADLVVVGIGVQPNTEWLEGSGLELADGIICDETLRAADGIYAAGDVARWPHPLFNESVRIEHWTNAAEQGHWAAQNLLAGDAAARPFAPVPYFWSDQYDTKIQLLGRAAGADEVRVVHGDPDALRFVALYRRNDRLLGAFTINLAQRFVAYRALIQRGASWDEALAHAAAVEARSNS